MLGTALDDHFRRDIRGVDDMLGWQQVSFCEVGVNAGRQVDILGRRRRRCDVRNQVRSLIIRRLGQVHLVAGSMGRPLSTPAGVRVIGRDNLLGIGRQLLNATPMQPTGRHE